MQDLNTIEDAIQLIGRSKNIVVLTGAGVSSVDSIIIITPGGADAYYYFFTELLAGSQIFVRRLDCTLG